MLAWISIRECCVFPPSGTVFIYGGFCAQTTVGILCFYFAVLCNSIAVLIPLRNLLASVGECHILLSEAFVCICQRMLFLSVCCVLLSGSCVLLPRDDMCFSQGMSCAYTNGYCVHHHGAIKCFYQGSLCTSNWLCVLLLGSMCASNRGCLCFH